MASTESRVEKIQKHFQVLTDVASSLNTASDELTQAVAVLDESLKRLNIGLTVWVTFASINDTEAPHLYDCDQIGYCKVNSTWGIALRRIWGDESIDHHSSDGPWLFNDASREMRINAVDKIPEVVEVLSKQASDTTKKIQEKAKQVRDLADAIKKSQGNGLITRGMSALQVRDIRSAIQQQQKFLGELIEHATCWELDGDELRIYFPADKRTFAEMMEGREPLAKIQNAAKQILRMPVKVSSRLEPKPVDTPQRASASAKVQK